VLHRVYGRISRTTCICIYVIYVRVYANKSTERTTRPLGRLFPKHALPTDARTRRWNERRRTCPHGFGRHYYRRWCTVEGGIVFRFTRAANGRTNTARRRRRRRRFAVCPRDDYTDSVQTRDTNTHTHAHTHRVILTPPPTIDGTHGPQNKTKHPLLPNRGRCRTGARR